MLAKHPPDQNPRQLPSIHWKGPILMPESRSILFPNHRNRSTTFLLNTNKVSTSTRFCDLSHFETSRCDQIRYVGRLNARSRKRRERADDTGTDYKTEDATIEVTAIAGAMDRCSKNSYRRAGLATVMQGHRPNA